MRLAPFDYTPYIPEGDVVIKRADLKGEAVGIDYNNVQQNISVSFCAIIFYESGMKREEKTTVNIRKGEMYHLDGEVISTAFHNHYLHGHIKLMEIIIMPTGCYPIKWRIKVEE